MVSPFRSSMQQQAGESLRSFSAAFSIAMLTASTALAQSPVIMSPNVTDQVAEDVEPSTGNDPILGDQAAPSPQPRTTAATQGAAPQSRRLLNSLNDLDRPLTPEEITAYGQSLRDQFPLDPSLIRDYRRRLNESQRAAAAPPNGIRPEPISQSLRVSLDTRGVTPQLDTSPGTVSIISFFDQTGAPWPIASFVVGREDAFQVYAMQEGSNQLAVAPLVVHGYSNLAVSLVSEDQPLVIDLETNEARSHYRLDLSVAGRGPNAIVPAVQTREAKQNASDELMMAFVQGSDIPKTAQRLSTDDSDVAAWHFNGNLYVRTNQTLQAPSWSATLSGPGGIKAYRLRPAPLVLITRNGQMTKVRISK